MAPNVEVNLCGLLELGKRDLSVDEYLSQLVFSGAYSFDHSMSGLEQRLGLKANVSVNSHDLDLEALDNKHIGEDFIISSIDIMYKLVLRLPLRSSSTENLIESLSNTLALITQSYKSHLPQTNNQLRASFNARNNATVQDGRVVVQDVRRRYNANNQERLFQRNNARGNVVAGNDGGVEFEIEGDFGTLCL
ncbi:hypothetical protein Tco_0363079 [Tanacetum coccineum]